jgi:predicted amino acid racemase
VLLAKALERNPGMLDAAIRLHQDGRIPPNTHLVDLDAVADNARAIAGAARRHGVRVFAVTKQDGHEPHSTRVALDEGLDAITAVEAMQAHRIHRFGFPIGNVGHTQQLPRGDVGRILAMEPATVTVYSVEAAAAVSEAAGRMGRVQPVYVTVANPGEEGTEPELVGGWTEAECVDGIRPMLELPHVRVAGIAQHVTIDYASQDDPATARPTEAFRTALRAKEALERELGLAELGINCAGNVNAITLGVLAGLGATEVEPGAALVGSGRFHALLDMPERPAQVHVSEITHHWNGNAYAIGGGFNFVWDMAGTLLPLRGLVGRTLDQAREQALEFRGSPWYDMHGLFADEERVARAGDTLLFVHLAQAMVERCYVAAVSGISRGEPTFEALFDNGLTMLDADLEPLPLASARDSVERVAREYERRRLGGG